MYISKWIVERDGESVPSEQIGLNRIAGNAAYQYDHCILAIAIKRYAIAVIMVEAITKIFAETDFTRNPVTTLVTIPAATVGRNRIDV